MSVQGILLGRSLTSPHDLSERRRQGLEPRAVLRVVFPEGFRRSRMVEVELTAPECLQLAERAVLAARLLLETET